MWSHPSIIKNMSHVDSISIVIYTMSDSQKSWTTFWQNQADSFNDVMKVSTAYFARRFADHFKISSNDTILDYGSGPGFLADSLRSLNINVTGADINPSFVEQYKQKHPQSGAILITPDPDSNRTIFDKAFNGKKFDYVILLSVSQYLENVAALEKIIHMLKEYISNNGKIVIADVVDPNTSRFRDLIAIKLECLKRGKIIAFTRFFFYLLFSNYRKFSQNVHLLRISEVNVNRIADKTGLRCQSTSQLTVHPTRTNYILFR